MDSTDWRNQEHACRPAMTQLSDQQIADVVTCALNSWGNKGGSIAVERVAAELARAAKEGITAASPTQHPTTVAETQYQGAASPVGRAAFFTQRKPAS
jgi:hypothetical protein